MQRIDQLVIDLEKTFLDMLYYALIKEMNGESKDVEYANILALNYIDAQQKFRFDVAG